MKLSKYITAALLFGSAFSYGETHSDTITRILVPGSEGESCRSYYIDHRMDGDIYKVIHEKECSIDGYYMSTGLWVTAIDCDKKAFWPLMYSVQIVTDEHIGRKVEQWILIVEGTYRADLVNFVCSMPKINLKVKRGNV